MLPNVTCAEHNQGCVLRAVLAACRLTPQMHAVNGVMVKGQYGDLEFSAINGEGIWEVCPAHHKGGWMSRPWPSECYASHTGLMLH